MLARWNATSQRLEAAAAVGPGDGWVHASAPSEAERGLLAQALGVPAAFLAHALDVDEVARLDHEGDASLVVVRMPVREAQGDLPYRTAPLVLVLLDGRVVTVSALGHEALERLGLPADLGAAPPLRFAGQLLARVAERYLADVRDIDRRADEVERRLGTSLRNREVLELLGCQKGLVHFETALASNRILLERLQRDERLVRTPADHELLEDVAVEFRQASEMAAISTNMLSETMDAFASIISNNLNAVMKRLTSLTLLLAIPTAVSSFFGMNVALPLARHPLAFDITVLGSLALVAVLGWLFRRWRWL